MMRWLGSNSGEPDEPGSVVPVSQSMMRTWLPLPGLDVPPYEVVAVALFSNEIFFASPLGWWMQTADAKSPGLQFQPA